MIHQGIKNKIFTRESKPKYSPEDQEQNFPEDQERGSRMKFPEDQERNSPKD